jgi:hypothetical protein
MSKAEGQREREEMPKTLRRVWQGWERVARAVGDVQARALLTLFYFVILGPFALVVRWGSDPLAIKAGAPRGWRPKGDGNRASSMDQATRQC